jgi:hypothetical protein
MILAMVAVWMVQVAVVEVIRVPVVQNGGITTIGAVHLGFVLVTIGQKLF